MDFILINRLNALYKKNYNEELNPKIINTLKRILLLQFDLKDLKGLDISIRSNFVSSGYTPFSTSKISLVNLYGNFLILEIDNKQGSCYLYSEHSIPVKRQGSDEADRIPFLEIKFDGAEEKPVIFTFLSNGHLIRQTFSGVDYDNSNNSLYPNFWTKYVYIYDFEIYCDAYLVRGRKSELSDAQPEFFGKYYSLDYNNPKNTYYGNESVYKNKYKSIRVEYNQDKLTGVYISDFVDNPIDRCLLFGVQIVDSLVPKSRVPGSGNDYTLARVPNI